MASRPYQRSDGMSCGGGEGFFEEPKGYSQFSVSVQLTADYTRPGVSALDFPLRDKPPAEKLKSC
jgi:hypothetical protein